VPEEALPSPYMRRAARSAAPVEARAEEAALERLRATAGLPDDLWRAVEEALAWAQGLDGSTR